MKRNIAIVGIVSIISSSVYGGGDLVTVEPVIEESVVVDNSSFYVGLALSAVSTRDSDVSMNIFNDKIGQDRLGNITLQAGYNFNEYIAVEGRYTTSFADEDFVKMDGWSLFVKPQYPVTEDINIYALLGYGGVNMDSKNGSNINVDGNGFQWGIGTSYDMMESIAVFFDYTNLANDMDGEYLHGTEADADAFNLGVTYQF